MRRWTERNRELARARSRAWKRANPEKAKDRRRNRPPTGTREQRLARCKLNNEIIAGRVKRQPCEVCGADKAQGHHQDYSKPLEVRWLCPTHHYAIHHEEEKRVSHA